MLTTKTRRHCVLILILSAATLLGILNPSLAAELAHQSPTTALARGGEPQQAIVVAAEAAAETRRVATELADYLGRISGAPFEVVVGDGRSGVAVGVQEDFPRVDHGVDFPTDDPLRQDQYMLRSHGDGVYVIGASSTGVTLAVWDLLHRLGYRLYFPTDAWEVIPQREDLKLSVDAVERPDFVTRRAPRGAPWSNNELWERWRRRNRVLSSFRLDTAHSYGRVYRARRATFIQHPEYCALVDGQRRRAEQVDGNIKFCISNAGLRQLVVDYAVEAIQSDPERISLSLDPSDGGHWCECQACQEMGSVSDRVVILAGEAAEAINQLGLGPKYIGIYAYNQHSPPPSVQVHPRVIVSIATSFIRGGYTLEQLIEGWRAQGATLGIRDYHDVFAWSHDRPRQARGGDIDYVCRVIPYFHAQGARFMNSENADSWGANGLGYWITPRLLWDLDNVDRCDDLIDDFLTNAFGPAQQPMRAFYQLLNRDHTPRSHEDLIARMYRHLDEACRRADDPRIHQRLDDLVLYTRYLELYHAYRKAQGDPRQLLFERVWRHAYRSDDRMMISTRAICQQDRFRDRAVKVPDRAAWNVPADKNPWKNKSPHTRQEIRDMLRRGIAANQPTVVDFEKVRFSEDLIPATPLHVADVAAGSSPERFRGEQTVFTWLPAASPRQSRRAVRLHVTGGLIKHYRDRGNVNIKLYASQGGNIRLVDEDRSVPPDGQPRAIVLRSDHSGLHLLQWSDGQDMTHIEWPEGLPRSFRATIDEPLELQGRWSLYFYVPRGTRTVGGFATAATGRILDDQATVVFSFEDEMDEADYFSVPVPAGRDGRLWQFRDCTGSRCLLTVPPYLASSARDLLLPREVVAADQ